MATDHPEVQSYAEQYFSSHNYLNKKIIDDISSIRDTFQNSWDSISAQEQEKVNIFCCL